MVRLPPLERFGPHGPLRLERTVKLLPVGAISITVRVPFEVERIEDLVVYHDLRFNDGVWLYDEVRDLAEQVRRELAGYYVRPVQQLGEEEAYTVFCINGPLKLEDGSVVGAEEWMQANRRAIAGLLTEERDPSCLSWQEAEESSGKYFSYYENDIVIIDWDAAVIVDEPRYFDEVLYIMELANLQLAELEAYDRILDDAVERSYRDMAAASRFWRLNTGPVQRELREIRIDLARLSDELSNITKFFGDWHLARVYLAARERFYLDQWRSSVERRLGQLDQLYGVVQSEVYGQRMFWLELLIVIFFAIDLLAIFVLKK
jgi:hypothetical protein